MGWEARCEVLGLRGTLREFFKIPFPVHRPPSSPVGFSCPRVPAAPLRPGVAVPSSPAGPAPGLARHLLPLALLSVPGLPAEGHT